nr:hypothetical protein [uncultured Cellulosilyticum sp.]
MMNVKELRRIAEQNMPVGRRLQGNEQVYYLAMRGLYGQHRKGEISLQQAQEEKEILTKWYEACEKKVEPIKEVVYLNKDKVVDAVILELGRYMSCGQNHEQREKAYPRKLFEERIVKVIDQAYKEA